MKTIDSNNYSEEIPKMVKVLPHGSKNKIAAETNETYTVVHNVWRGRTYKQNIVDSIIRRYNEVVKSHKPVKAA